MATPSELRVRAARPDDYASFVRYFAELGVHDPVPVAAEWERGLMPSLLFFELQGQSVAYAFYETLADTGYVRHLVVDPAMRGRGLGASVMAELEARIRSAGCTQMCLNVKRKNAAALRLYASVGMRAAFGSVGLRFAWARIDRIADAAGSPSQPLQVSPLPIELDDRVELDFGVHRGLFRARRQRGNALLVVHAASTHPAKLEPLGVASFDPEFPRAFPFCARSAAAARALLEVMRARTASPAVLLVVENDLGLEQQLRAAGAEVALEAWHYCKQLRVAGADSAPASRNA